MNFRGGGQLILFLERARPYRANNMTRFQIFRKNPTPPATSLCETPHTTATIKNKGRLQPLIRSAEKVTACNLPPLQDLYSSRNLGWAGRTVADLTTHNKLSEKQKPKRNVSSCLKMAALTGPRKHSDMDSYVQAPPSIRCINEKSTHLIQWEH